MSNIERDFVGCSRDIFHRNIEDDEPFCTQENWQSSVIFLNQEVELMGLPSICSSENGASQLDVISMVNVSWSLVQGHKEKLKRVAELETQIRKLHGDVEQMHGNSQRLRDLIEYKERQAADSESRERQTLVMNQKQQADLKLAKEEIKKLSSMVLHRESRFNHEAKKKDQEIAKLKERLLKVIGEAKQNSVPSVSIEIIGDMLDKPNGGTRSRWKNDAEDQRRSDDLLQKAIDAYQERQESLTTELTHLQELVASMMADISGSVAQGIELPNNFDGIKKEWQTLVEKIGITKPIPEESQGSKELTDHFQLDTFVPLSNVKHAAPPGWVSRAHCTLPPTGKAETVKLRTAGGGASSGSDTRPRPRSSHLSPYRGMQAPVAHNQAIYRSAKGSTRSGSMSPTSASPTRQADTRSLPRMTGSKLSLRKTSSHSQASSANNSSADEGRGPSSSSYCKIVGRRSSGNFRLTASRPQSPASAVVSPAESETESCNELTNHLRKLGKYLERKQSNVKSDSDSVLDPQMDEHLANIRKALNKSGK